MSHLNFLFWIQSQFPRCCKRSTSIFFVFKRIILKNKFSFYCGSISKGLIVLISICNVFFKINVDIVRFFSFIALSSHSRIPNSLELRIIKPRMKAKKNRKELASNQKALLASYNTRPACSNFGSEPKDGLDPNQKQEVRAIIQGLSKNKAIILC